MFSLVTACNSSSPPPTTITGGTAILPQRRLICRLREAVTGDHSTTPAPALAHADIIHLDSSTTTTATVGALVRVELQMSSGTGYGWIVGTDKAHTNPAPVLTPQFDWTQATGLETPLNLVMPGVPGVPGGLVQCAFDFTATQAGSTTLTFKLSRPWEADAPAKTVVLTVHIVAADH